MRLLISVGLPQESTEDYIIVTTSVAVEYNKKIIIKILNFQFSKHQSPDTTRIQMTLSVIINRAGADYIYFNTFIITVVHY
jgi:hypothetical protein